MSDIRNKWLGNPFKNQSVKCGHFCIFLCKPNLLETKSDSERISASSMWPGSYRGSILRDVKIIKGAIIADVGVGCKQGMKISAALRGDSHCDARGFPTSHIKKIDMASE